MDWLHGLRYQWRRSLGKWNTLWTQRTVPGVHGVKLVVSGTVGLRGGVCCVTPTGLHDKGNVEHRWDCKHSVESQF